ncbi:hydrogenase expression/formation protein HypE [Pirellulaceae bacterium SH449]
MNESLIGQCPVPVESNGEVVTLAHGEGGRATRELLEKRILPWLTGFSGDALTDYRTDAAYLDAGGKSLAFTTDSYVVSPLVFPGGDIGTLAIFGTCNDLSMMGAEPKWMSVSLIIEEGLSLAQLERIVTSLAKSAFEAGVKVVTGDTKVVPRGCADGFFINTSGIGVLRGERLGGGEKLQPGDRILVTGPIAQHGLAILAAREGFGIDGEIQSDCGLLWPAVEALLAAGIAIRAMRDATRGGVAGVLHEWARDSGHSLVIDQSRIPLTDSVRGMSELLGLDPLMIANEGTMLVAVAESEAARAVQVLRKVPIAQRTEQIGEVKCRASVPVAVIRSLGRQVPLDESNHALLPRIC